MAEEVVKWLCAAIAAGNVVIAIRQLWPRPSSLEVPTEAMRRLLERIK